MPSLSRTAAKRQAHRESSMHRLDGGKAWDVVTRREIGPTGQGLSFAAARAELAAWRAARVRELMGLMKRDGGGNATQDYYTNTCSCSCSTCPGMGC